MKILFFCIPVFFLLSACKKNNISTTCHADEIKFFSNGTLNGTIGYEYDDQERLKKIITISGERTYAYFSDSIVITEGNGRTVYYLGNNGLVTSSREKAIVSDPAQLQLDDIYTYDAEGYLVGQREIFSQLYNGNILRDTVYTNYTVLNGNIIKVASTDSYEEYFEYSTSVLRENVPILNPFRSNEGSFFGKPLKNLILKAKDASGNIHTVYSYSFALAGKVLEMTGTFTGPPAGSSRTVFHYRCD